VEPDQYGRAFALSRDVKRLALAREDAGSWIVDLRRGTRTKIGGGRLAGFEDVRWSADGERLAWAAAGAADDPFPLRIYVQAADGRGEPSPLPGGANDLYLAGWTPNGSALVYARMEEDNTATTIERQAIDGKSETIWSESAALTHADLSPDGRVVAFEADAGDGYQVALLDIASRQRIAVTSAGGREPAWSRDGRELFFRRGDAIWVVPIETGASGVPQVGAERKLFDWPAVYVWTPGSDGYFYGTEPVPGASVQTSLELRTGWLAEIERLAGTGQGR